MGESSDAAAVGGQGVSGVGTGAIRRVEEFEVRSQLFQDRPEQVDAFALHPIAHIEQAEGVVRLALGAGGESMFHMDAVVNDDHVPAAEKFFHLSRHMPADGRNDSCTLQVLRLYGPDPESVIDFLRQGLVRQKGRVMHAVVHRHHGREIPGNKSGMEPGIDVDDIGPGRRLRYGHRPRGVLGAKRKPGDLRPDAPAAQSFHEAFRKDVRAAAGADRREPDGGLRNVLSNPFQVLRGIHAGSLLCF